MQLDEGRMTAKVGCIPYVRRDNGDIAYLFMVPSDPQYGGTRPQIAKGNVDAGENLKQAGLREAKEELGLIESNIISTKLVWQGRPLPQRYDMSVYVCEIRDVNKFDQPHFETGSTHWLTLEQFKVSGRGSHLPAVQAAEDAIRNK